MARPKPYPDQTKDYVRRFDAAQPISRAEILKRGEAAPSSLQKYESFREGLTDPDTLTPELIVGGQSATRTFARMRVSEISSLGGNARGDRYPERDKWIKYLAEKISVENPGETDKRIHELVRKNITDIEEHREWGSIPGEHLISDINKVLELCTVNDVNDQSTVTIMTENAIKKVLSKK